MTRCEFYLHGDENALVGLAGVVQALTSFVHNKGDTIQSISYDHHQIWHS